MPLHLSNTNQLEIDNTSDGWAFKSGASVVTKSLSLSALVH